MKIGLDVRMMDHSGIGTTIRGLLDHWSPERRRHLVLFGKPGSAPPPAPLHWKDAPHGVYSLRQHWGYGRALNLESLSLFHMPHFDVPLSYKGPLIATVHDLIHLILPEHSTKPLARLYARVLLGHVARRAARIIVVSENTKKDLLRFFPEAEPRVRVLHPGVDPAFTPVAESEAAPVLEKYGLSAGYLLYVGNLRGSKNTPRLLAAYEELRRSESGAPPLVLVGRNTYRTYEKIGFPEGVRALSEVPRRELPALFSSAAAFVFPSLYEGFGLPPLEAMACGTAVVASRTSSLPEVCGDAAIYVDPLSVSSIADGIRSVLADSARRRALEEEGLKRSRRFNWSSFADGTWKVYEEILGTIS